MRSKGVAFLVAFQKAVRVLLESESLNIHDSTLVRHMDWLGNLVVGKVHLEEVF